MGSRGTKGKSAAKPRGKRIRIRRAAKSVRRHAPKVSDRDVRNDALARELADAREQQAATLKVLQVISSSPGELTAVFEAMLTNATRICGAEFGMLMRYESGKFHPAAMHNVPSVLADYFYRQGPFLPPAGTPFDRALTTKQVIHTADLTQERVQAPSARLAGARSHIVVPMLKEGEFVGAIIMFRTEVRPFGDKQVALLTNFAAQAVIAIENARLLNELRRRTDDLTESLEQQTATSDVLEAIASSQGELQQVFRTMLERAARICSAKFGVLYLCEGNSFRAVALGGAPPPLFEEARRRNPVVPGTPGTGLGRVVATKQPVQIADARAEPAYYSTATHAVGPETGVRTVLCVPLLREGELLGAFNLLRDEVRPFSEKQVGLVQAFAAQAVIAIENARLLNELRQRTDDLTESLEQQTATSEVLKVISASPSDLGPVFNAILENATLICHAKMANLHLYANGVFRVVAMHNATPSFAELRLGVPTRPAPDTVLGRVARTKQVTQVADLTTAPSYLRRDPLSVSAVEGGGMRTLLGVPMLQGEDLVGCINIYRQEVQPFTAKQIELLQHFAAQAVIAIENTRLLNELRQRTDDLSESLEQQTATSEVLKVISSSPGELEPVFNAMLENAVRICGAQFGNLALYDGRDMRVAAMYNPPAAYRELRQREPVAPSGSLLGVIAASKSVTRFDDLTVEPYASWALPKIAGAKSAAGVPMLRDGELAGAIVIYRTELQAFTDKQIELLQNFAAQAVIAIENTRLLNELRQRTDDLSESLEQQTATSEVLKVISSSPGEVQLVFETMLENAVRICDARFGALALREGENFRTVALHNAPAAYAELRRRDPLIRPPPTSGLGRIASTRQVVHIADLLEDQAYRDRVPSTVALAETAGARTLVVVPMLKDDNLAGVIAIYRQQVRPFTDKQIELLKNFAAQAVIAIENTRLLGELRESLQQQTATSDVLKVISSSPGDLKPVFETMLANAVRICGAKFGNLLLFEDDRFRHVALHGAPEAYSEERRRNPVIRPRPGSDLDQLIKTKKTVHTSDLPAAGSAATTAIVELAGARTMLIVPMLKDDELVGTVGIYRQEVRPFTQKQIELLQNFADQAVIAIENARLLNELRESLRQQTATSNVLKVISQSTFDLQTVLDTLVASACQLCEADIGNISRPTSEGLFRFQAHYGMPPAMVKDLERRQIKAGRGTAIGRVLLDRTPAHVEDVLNDPDYELIEMSKLGGYRTLLAVPLLREGEPVGVFVLARRVVRPFTARQIDLVSTFADQAAIAIENVRLFDEIQDKSRQLAEASQHKSQFLASMSHELRTPLNAILGYTELIADGIYGAPPEKMQHVLKRVESNGRHLLGLINAVLDLSKIEAGQLTLDLADYLLQNVAQTVYNAVEPLALDKKLLFKAEVAPNLPPGRGDERRLTQVLLNLVGNAIKFTDAGEVVIKAGASNGDFHLSVRDTGPGVSAADQAKLFQEFQQADNPKTRKKEGTGLGLAISKRIVEMHGGRIWIESQLGQGSTFFVTLPVQVAEQIKATN